MKLPGVSLLGGLLSTGYCYIVQVAGSHNESFFTVFPNYFYASGGDLPFLMLFCFILFCFPFWK